MGKIIVRKTSVARSGSTRKTLVAGSNIKPPTEAAHQAAYRAYRSRSRKKEKIPKPPTVPTKWCRTCKQGSKDLDRDAPPGEKIKVIWARLRYDRFGRKVPNGFECYPCFSVRHRFWADKDQNALNTLLESDTNEKDTHAEARRAKVCKDKKFTTAETKMVFDHRFVEGSFVPLRTYATQRGLDASDTVLDVDLAMDVMQKFGKRVKRCEVSGELGIEYKEAMCKDRHSRWGNDVDDDRTKLKM